MLHNTLGNVFAEHCPRCGHRRVIPEPTPLIGQKPTGNVCGTETKRGTTCRGNMVDSVLDWEHDLPEPWYTDSTKICKKADLSIVLGSSLQIQPGKRSFYNKISNAKHLANTLPTTSKKMVIVNLSKTKMDAKADLIINAKCDQVMRLVMAELAIKVPKFEGPVINENSTHGPIQMKKYETPRKRRKFAKDEKLEAKLTKI